MSTLKGKILLLLEEIFFSLKSGHVFEGYHSLVKMTEKEEGLLIHLMYGLSSPVIQGPVVQN